MISIDMMKTWEFRLCFLLIYEFLLAVGFCGSVALFDFKNLTPFFTFKRVLSLFLFIFCLQSIGSLFNGLKLFQ